MSKEFTTAFTKFINYIAQDQKKPQRDFLSLFLPGILVSREGALTLKAIAEGIRGKFVSRTSRPYATLTTYLSRNLRSSRMATAAILKRYLELTQPVLNRQDGEGVNVAVDGTDWQKPHAQPHKVGGMQGASSVRDGSKSTKKNNVNGMGYSGVTVEASLPGGIQLPLLHWIHTKSATDPLFGTMAMSEGTRHAEAVAFVAPHVGKLAWWSFDRGYGAQHYFDAFDRAGIRWLVRVGAEGVVAKRWVTTSSKVHIHLDELVHTLPTPYVVQVREGEGDERLTIRMGLIHIHLESDGDVHPTVRTLMVGWLNDAPTPFVLLAGEKLELGNATAEMMRTEYLRRWRVEESHRLAKDRKGHGGATETFQVLKFVSIQRLLLFWMFAQGFIALQRIRESRGMQLLTIEIAGKWGLGPKDPRYQLTPLIAQSIRNMLPKLYRKLHPPHDEKRAGTPGDRTERKQRRLQQLEKEERNAARKAERRAMERERLLRRL